jgi:hypothetical protein
MCLACLKPWIDPQQKHCSVFAYLVWFLDRAQAGLKLMILLPQSPSAEITGMPTPTWHSGL